MAQDLYDMLVEHILENQQRFYRVAYRYVENKDNALDVVQNSICKALESYGNLRSREAMKTWFYRILVNESLTFLKKNKREVVCDPWEMREEEYLEPAYDRDPTVYSGVSKLPMEMQTIVILHFFEGLTLKEISQITGVNLNTVKTRLYSALGRLKKEMLEV